MKISHIAVFVSELERSKAFYERYFGGVAGEKYHNPNTGLQTYFISFEGDVRLEIMYSPNKTHHRDVTATGYAHIAFSAGSRSEVDQLTERIRLDGYTVASEPRVTGDGYYESVVLDPDGNSVEITE